MKTKFIILFILSAFFVDAQNNPPQNSSKKISGIIKDQNGEILFGAVVNIPGSKVSATTDSLGRYSFSTTQEPPFKIQVNYIGFKRLEKDITALTEGALDFSLELDNNLNEVSIVSSRRREEAVQDVPIAITVIGGTKVAETGAFNVNRVKELVPSVQLYSSNPRNTGLNIRGLGSSFGLTNDGIDPGVGFYVDGVYYARAAATTLDFLDVERIEVLRGPQGTLFGKNTTAGAFNITSRKPTFTPEGSAELSYGNFQYVQAKATVSAAITKKIAGRVSFSSTQRDGLIENVKTQEYINTLNNQGIRGQLLITPTDKLSINLSSSYTNQRPKGYAQVVAGVVPTERASFRQFNSIAADLGYKLPSQNAFDRKIDQDTPWRSYQEFSNSSLNVDYKIGEGTLTSTSSWGSWHWDPSNDRDFTGLQALRLSQNPSDQTQWSQELRYAGQLTSKLSGVAGIYAIGQEVKVNGKEESGKDQWRFSQDKNDAASTALWKTPGLLEGYGISTKSDLKSFSSAAFINIDWNVFKGLHISPGIRYNYDEKIADYNRTTYGGLQTTNPKLIALQQKVYSSQAYHKGQSNTNLSYNITASYKFSDKINVFGTYATAYKPIGVNVAGIPTSTLTNTADLNYAIIKPEYSSYYEFGIKTSPTQRSKFNVNAYNNDITDYQTNVQSAELGVNRGYLANAEKVNVKGIEAEGSLAVKEFLSVFVSGSYTDGKYVKFTNAPLPLEATGHTVTIDGKSTSVSYTDVSGQRLPGISKWAGSFGGELSLAGKFLQHTGRFYLASEVSYRSEFSSSPSPSKYLNIDGYLLVNARIGFRAAKGVSFIVWSRNLLDKNYYEQLLPAGGNAGQYGAVLGDQRTYGVTLKYSF